jgi:hypothetical protein
VAAPLGDHDGVVDVVLERYVRGATYRHRAA